MLVSTLFAGLLAGSLVSASPLDSDAAVAMRAEEGQMGARTDSGCYYLYAHLSLPPPSSVRLGSWRCLTYDADSASPKCCVPTVCMCLDSRIYQINRDNTNHGLHGCDPPWGLIANSYPQHPASCCRVALDGAAEEGEEA